MQKLVNDAAAENVSGDAQYSTRSFKKLAQPATTQSNSVEARYETRTYSKTTPATTRSIDIPAEYKTVSRRQLVKAGGFTEWKEVVCETAPGYSDLVRRVQVALNSRGYDVGTPDNQNGPRTKAALIKFQKDNGLPVGLLDLDTLRTLGVQ